MTPARQFARLIMLIGFITLTISWIFVTGGQKETATYICGCGMGIAFVLLMFGGVVVGADRIVDE